VNQTEVENKIFQLLATVYGPYAFGMISLLIIWFTIVAPQLTRQAVDYQKNETIVDSLKSVAVTVETAARSLERTAITLDSVVKKLEQ
jgi:hypothetical protein